MKTPASILPKALVLLLGIIILSPIRTSAQDSLELRVMTYNIRYLNTIDSINIWDNRKDNVAALVRFHNVDVVGMQEVNGRQLQDLQQRLPGFGWTGKPRVESRTGEYSPIFYRQDRYELVNSGTFWFSETPELKESKSWDSFYPRVCSWGKFVEKKSGFEFYFFNTHFDHRGEIARQKSALIMRHYADSIAVGKPVIFGGDFNCRESSVAYNNLTSDGKMKDSFYLSKTPHYGPVNTSSGFFVRTNPPRARIDYIFVNDRVAVKQHATLTDSQEGRYYSDHLPVIAVLAIGK